METVPGEFDADDMIVMDGITVDQTNGRNLDGDFEDDGTATIANQYIVADNAIGGVGDDQYATDEMYSN